MEYRAGNSRTSVHRNRIQKDERKRNSNKKTQTGCDYFYLTAFIDDKKLREDFNILNDSFPTIYRMDRIHSLKILKEKFNIPYKDRFEEGEFRKRIQFMYGGPLRKVRFKYSGISVEVVLDRLPTARILHEDESGYTIEAEVFGEGIKMWIRSQGELISEVSYR